MICNECKDCKKFITNDCPGSAEFNKSSCEGVLKKLTKETDVGGCC